MVMMIRLYLARGIIYKIKIRGLCVVAAFGARPGFSLFEPFSKLIVESQSSGCRLIFSQTDFIVCSLLRYFICHYYHTPLRHQLGFNLSSLRQYIITGISFSVHAQRYTSPVTTDISIIKCFVLSKPTRKDVTDGSVYS